MEKEGLISFRHVIQVEKERARDGEVNDVFTPPSSPHLQKDAQKEVRTWDKQIHQTH